MRNRRCWSPVARNIPSTISPRPCLKRAMKSLSRSPSGSPTDQTLLNDATPVFLPTQEQDGYTISPDAFEASSPHEPKPLSSTAPVIRPARPTIERRSKASQPWRCVMTS